MGNEAGKMNAKGWIHRGWSSWEMCKKKKKRIGENKKIYNHESVTFHSDGQLTWFTEFHVYNETVQ